MGNEISPAAILYDASGNPIRTFTDGTNQSSIGLVPRIQKADNSFVAWKTTNAAELPGMVVYDVNGTPISFGAAPVPANPTLLVSDMAKNGASADLRVDGSVTPVDFTFLADATKDLYISDITFIIVANSLIFGSDKFAGLSALTNGVLVQITASGGQVSTLATLKKNEDFMFFATAGGWDMFIANSDIIRSAYTVGGAMTLKAGTADKILVRVQDDIDSGISFFQCQIRAVKQE